MDFFLNLLRIAAAHGTEALVVIEDIRHKRGTVDAASLEADVTRMFLERADNYLRWARVNDYGVVIVDRPGGGRREEDMSPLREDLH